MTERSGVLLWKWMFERFGISEGKSSTPPPSHHEIRSCLTNNFFFCVSNVRNSCLKCLGSSVCRCNWIKYDNHGGGLSLTLYTRLNPRSPYLPRACLLNPLCSWQWQSSVPKRWGTLMDSVCYWGRRGVLHPLPPPPVNVCVCVCAHEEWRSWNFPAFASCSVPWNGAIDWLCRKSQKSEKIWCSQPHGFCWFL